MPCSCKIQPMPGPIVNPYYMVRVINSPSTIACTCVAESSYRTQPMNSASILKLSCSNANKSAKVVPAVYATRSANVLLKQTAVTLGMTF